MYKAKREASPSPLDVALVHTAQNCSGLVVGLRLLERLLL